jgi:hypothetical protein
MEDLDTNLTSNDSESDNSIINTISVNQYTILAITTFGLYNIWWIYKAWSFFRNKENSDIMAAGRALFSIIFLIPLFQKILKLSKNYEYKPDYSSIILFLGFFITNLLGYLPAPYFLIAIFSFVFLIPPFKALNFAMVHSEGFQVIEQDKFNGRQIFLLIVGGLIWLLIFIGLLL